MTEPISSRRALLSAAAVVIFNLALSSLWLGSTSASAAARDYLGSSSTLVLNVADGLAIAALAVWFARRDASLREAFGLTSVPVPRAIAWAAIAAVGSKLVAIPLVVVAHVLGSNNHAMLHKIEQVAGGPIVTVIAVALWAGIWEELVFRGFVMSRVRIASGRWCSTSARADWAAIVIQAAAFGLLHLWQSPQGQLNAALTGLVLGYVAVRCRSIIPGMFGHAVIDLAALFVARAGLAH